MENLEAARLAVEADLYNAGVSRAYYACLQAAHAAASREGYGGERPDHRGTVAIFDNELVRRRHLYPAELRGVLSQLQSLRIKADYHAANVSRRGAGRALRVAGSFVDAVRGRIIAR